jgi:hypothetical protein
MDEAEDDLRLRGRPAIVIIGVVEARDAKSVVNLAQTSGPGHCLVRSSPTDEQPQQFDVACTLD